MDIDGNEVSLSDFRGQVVVINFWSSTCSPCVKELPLIEEFYQKWQDEVVVLAINEDFNQEHIGEIVRNSGYHFPVLLDTQITSKSYQLQFIPATYFIDSEGIIRADAIGAFTSLEQIEEKLAFAMPEQE
jgi:thiol-disulfide isomerase/thioredoxin